MFLIAENIIQIIFLILSFSMNSWSSDGSFLERFVHFERIFNVIRE